MSEYCEYMWNPTRGHNSLALARSLYHEDHRVDPKDKKLAVKTVRAILTDMPNVDLRKCTDEYVEKFLYARKHRTEQAAALIVAYQNQIAHRQDIFGNLTARDPALQRALRAGIPGVLPARDRKGRCVLVILASQWDPIAVPALAVQRAIFLVLEILIQDPRNQHCGFVAVVDWGGFSLRQGGALGTAALRNLISALRGRFPARFKAIHFLSSPFCVQATLALARPFLDDKTWSKIFLHGNNLTTLHEHLPTDILPAELGGTGPAFNPGLWAEPVIHSAMKEAEIAATLAQKERDSRARDLVELMQAKGSGKDEPRRIGGNAVELSEIKVSRNQSDKTERISSNETKSSSTDTQLHQEVQAQLHECPDEEGKNNRDKMTGNIISNESKISRREHDRDRLLNFADEDKITELEDEPKRQEANENGEKLLSSVDVEVNKCREKNDRKIEDSDFEDKNIRSEPDGLPDDIESLDLHSETNSNEFEMVPSRPGSESSKDSSFEVDLHVEKIVVRDGAKSSTLSEEASLVT